jgi:hypothetical protein
MVALLDHDPSTTAGAVNATDVDPAMAAEVTVPVMADMSMAANVATTMGMP